MGTPIKNICSRVCSGGTPRSSYAPYYNGGIPWLNTKEIDFNFINSTERTISIEGLENSSAKWIEAPAVIVAMYGATAGKCAISNIRLTTNQACCNLIINPELADYRFVYYSLKNDYTRLASLANGGAQQNLNAQQIKDFEIPTFSLDLQKKIAAILSSLDDKIETNRAINARLEELAAAIFKSWFIDFEPFAEDEFVEDEHGRRPKGWNRKSLSNIAKYINGLAMQKYPALSNSDKLPVLKIKELGQGYCSNDGDFCSKNSIGEQYLINDGDVIFSWSGTLMVKIWTGGQCGLNQHLFKVVSDKYPKWFIYLWTKYHNDKFIRIAKDKAVTMGHIKREELDKALAVIPQEDIFIKIDNILAPIIDEYINRSLENNRLASLRDTLLPRLMSGELKPE